MVTGKRAAGLLILVLGVSLVVFGGTLGNGFVWDDLAFIINNTFLHDMGNVPRFFLVNDAHGTGGINPYYRPLTTLSFALDRWLWGDNAAGYHLVNLILHLLVVTQLYAVIRLLTGHPLGALLAALLFAIHPATSEPVAFVSARADLWCALFMLGSFRLFLAHLSDRRLVSIAASLVLAAAATFSKIVAITLPLLMGVHLVATGEWRRRWRLLIPHGAVAAAFLLVREAVVSLPLSDGNPLATRLATAGTILVRYLWHAVWPFDLQVMYDVPVQTALGAPVVLCSWGLAGGLVWRAWQSRVSRPAGALGAVWFVAALLPVSGIIQFMAPSLMADRYLYVPLCGAAMALGEVLSREPRRWWYPGWRRVAVVGTVGLVACLAAETTSRIPQWRDEVSLWSREAPRNPRNVWVHHRLAEGYIRQERSREADEVLHHLHGLGDGCPELWNQWAEVALLRGDFALAEHYLFRALEGDASRPRTLLTLGKLIAETGNREQAIKALRKALSLNPHDREAAELLQSMEARLPA